MATQPHINHLIFLPPCSSSTTTISEGAPAEYGSKPRKQGGLASSELFLPSDNVARVRPKYLLHRFMLGGK